MSIITFLKEFFVSPSSVGSICPSSNSLTSRLVSQITLSNNADGIIIDLGAGSGVVSKQLLCCGFSPKKILALELSPGFKDEFARNCPGVNLQIADARELDSLIKSQYPDEKVCIIISSLPFRSFPTSLSKEILSHMRKILSEHNAILVQYTYAWWLRYPLKQFGLSPLSSSIVVKNLPPAKVEVYSSPSII